MKSILDTVLNKNLLIILLILVAIFFRFYNGVNRYSLGIESVRDANVAIIGASQFLFPLTGPFSSFGPFTFGPWFWYHLILFHMIFPFYYSSWIILGVTSLVFVYTMYKIGELLGGKDLGLIVAALATVCRYLIAWAGFLSNPGFTFVYAGLSIYLFLRIIKNNSSGWWWLFLGLTIGVGINMHYQMFPYVLLPLLLACYHYKKFLYIIFSYIGVGITFIPIGVFDLMNNGYTIRNFIHSYITLKERIYVPNSWKIYLFDFWPETFSFTLGIPENWGIALIVMMGVVSTYLFLRRKLTKEFTLLSVFFAIAFLHLRYYSGERSMSYMHYLMPFIFIYTGYFIWILYNFQRFGKYLATGILFCLLYVMTNQAVTELKTSQFTQLMYAYKEGLEDKYPQQNFSLYHCRNENSGTIMSILFLLDKEKRITDNGVKIALGQDNCNKKLAKKYTPHVEKITLKNNLTVLNISNLSETERGNLGWEQYTMQKLFTASAFWWVGKDL